MACLAHDVELGGRLAHTHPAEKAANRRRVLNVKETEKKKKGMSNCFFFFKENARFGNSH